MDRKSGSAYQACEIAGGNHSERDQWAFDIANLAVNEAIINCSESKERTEKVLHVIEQQIRPKVYQQVRWD